MGVALITPFKEDESVDYDALLRLVDYQLQNGTDFLCVLGDVYKRQSKDYMAAMRKYSGVKVMQIIGEIRYCDAKSKGVGLSLIHI